MSAKECLRDVRRVGRDVYVVGECCKSLVEGGIVVVEERWSWGGVWIEPEWTSRSPREGRGGSRRRRRRNPGGG